MRKTKKNYQTNPDPYEDIIRLEKLDPYETLIDVFAQHKKKTK